MPHTTPPHSSSSLLPTRLLHTGPLRALSQLHFKLLVLALSCIALGYTLSTISTLSSLRHASVAVPDEYSTLAGAGTDAAAAGGSLDAWLGSNLTDRVAGHLSSLYGYAWGTGGGTGITKERNGSSVGANDSVQLASPLLPEDVIAAPPSALGSAPAVGKVVLVSRAALADARTAVAMRTQERHNARQGYGMRVLRPSVLEEQAGGDEGGGDGVGDKEQRWDKQVYLLAALVAELARPRAERVQWLAWVGSGSVVLNQMVPLEVFLPPEDGSEAGFAEMDVLVREEDAGDIVMLRVCPRSVEMLSSVVAVAEYYPDMNVTGGDRAAVEFVVSDPRYEGAWIKVPGSWFDARRGAGNETVEVQQIRKGDFMVDLSKDAAQDEKVEEFLADVGVHSSEWDVVLEATRYPREVKTFWRQQTLDKETARIELQNLWIEASKSWEEVTGRLRDAADMVSEGDRTEIERTLTAVELAMREDKTKNNAEILRKAMANLKWVITPLDTIKEKASNELRKEANDAIYSAVQLAAIAHSSETETETEIEEVQESISSLKSILTETNADTARVRQAIDELKDARQKLEENNQNSSNGSATEDAEGSEDAGSSSMTT